MRKVQKTLTGFREDRSDFTTLVLEWDQEGEYLGQWQDNMLDDFGGYIFIKGHPDRPVPALTIDEMLAANRAHALLSETSNAKEGK